MKKAILTICAGTAYQAMGTLTCPLMRRYADRIGAEFVVLDSIHLPKSCFSKFAIFDWIGRYDRLLFLDVDTIVRGDCPDLFSLVPEGVFGAFDEHKLADDVQKATHVEYMRRASGFYGIPMDNFRFFNTGVMVLGTIHRELFAHAEQYLQEEYYDQLLVNLRLGNLKLDTFDIGYKFNRMQYVDGRVPGTRLDAHIVHYAGIQKCNALIQTDLDRWAGDGLV